MRRESQVRTNKRTAVGQRLRSWPGGLVTSVTERYAVLSVPNFRIYSAGQVVSLAGAAIQTTVLSWWVLALTRSPQDVGLVAGWGLAPALIAGPYAGVVVDRVKDKRRALAVVQASMAGQSLLLGVLAASGLGARWGLWALCPAAALLGACIAFDTPTRSVLMVQLVGRERLGSAISLYSVVLQVATLIGAGAGALMYASLGPATCFWLNAVSFSAVLVALAKLDQRTFHPVAAASRAQGQLLDGLRYAACTPAVRWPLLITALLTAFVLQAAVCLPVMATVLHGGAHAYGLMVAVAAAGSLVAGVAGTGREHIELRACCVPAAIGAIGAFAAAAAPSLSIELLALPLVGWGSLLVSVRARVIPQRYAPGAKSGRVMALWSVAHFGGMAVGAPIVGAAMSHNHSRAGLVLAAAANVVILVLAMTLARRGGDRPERED
jgi:MFS family permease